jgi:arylsulfatase A-like enzyme/tetratricopeptide (TPR) repeat protein
MPRKRKTSGKTPAAARRVALPVGLGLIALLIVLIAVAWFRPAPGAARPRNVLLITLDTLRADALGSYGNRAAATPWLDRLASGGLRFTDARAHNVVTLPSHANILTGRLPPDHGVRDNAGFRLAAGEATLTTRLKAAGYRTGAFVSAFPLDSRFGLARGFDVYDDAFVDASARPAFLEQERAGVHTVEAASRWLHSLQNDTGTVLQPWFLWVHLYEPHYPYSPPAPFSAQFKSDAYAGEVAATDAALGPLLQPILDGARTDTLVVMTSDHGESLGDHGEATHGIFAYDTTLKVPLVVYAPALVPPTVVAEPASHVDIVPTILEALGMPAAPDLRGRSLLRAAGDHQSNRPTYFEALSGSLNRGWAPLSGVVADGLKFIELPIPELYDLRSDPQELNNLASERPQQVVAYRTLLASVGPSPVRRTEETGEVKERLRALGYVASSPRPSGPPTEADDPKRLVAIETELQDIVGLSLEGKGPEALARARALVARRPDMKIALLQLAHLEREAEHLPAAITALQRAHAIGPDDPETAALLAASLIAGNKPADAITLLRPFAEASDADVQVLTTLALAEARSGRSVAALQTLDRARAQDPSNPSVPIARGTVELMAGRRAEARAAFEAALALNGSLARAHSSLAVMAAEEGRREDSLQQWRRAVAVDPAEFEKLLAVGLSLAHAGRGSEARPYLQLFADAAPASRYAADVTKAREWLRRERQ